LDFIILNYPRARFFEIITSIDNAIINAEVLRECPVKGPGAGFFMWVLFLPFFVIRGTLAASDCLDCKSRKLVLIGVFFCSISQDPKLHRLSGNISFTAFKPEEYFWFSCLSIGCFGT